MDPLVKILFASIGSGHHFVLRPRGQSNSTNGEERTGMPNTSFEFIVGHSFLEYASHPITIPRSAVDYKALEAGQLNRGDYVIIFPKGERLMAKMCDGVSSYGAYYQLRATGSNRDVPSYLRTGTRVHVVLARLRGRNHAILEEAAL